MKRTNDIHSVAADWKDFGGFIENLKITLKKLGIHITDDPMFDGTDMYGVLISKEKITKSRYKKYVNETFDEDMDKEFKYSEHLIEN